MGGRDSLRDFNEAHRQYWQSQITYTASLPSFFESSLPSYTYGGLAPKTSRSRTIGFLGYSDLSKVNGERDCYSSGEYGAVQTLGAEVEYCLFDIPTKVVLHPSEDIRKNSLRDPYEIEYQV